MIGEGGEREMTYNVLCSLGVLWLEGANESHFSGLFVL